MSLVTNYELPRGIQVRLNFMKKEYTRLSTDYNLSTFAIAAFLTVVTAAMVITAFVFPILVLIPIVAGIVGTPLLYLLWIKKIEDQKDKLFDSIRIEEDAISQFEALSLKSMELNNQILLNLRKKEGIENHIQLKKEVTPGEDEEDAQIKIERHKKGLADLVRKREDLDNEILGAPSADSPEVMYLKAKIHALTTAVEGLKKPSTETARNTIKIQHLKGQITAINAILNDPTTVASNFAELLIQGKI